MFGKPDDVPDECNAHLCIGDDFADNCATIRCQLEPGHEGLHRETYTSPDSGIVTITWEKDEKKPVEDLEPIR